LVRETAGMVKAVDQWTLLAVVMAGQCGGRKEAWTAGFKRVNLHPHYKRPLLVWLSEINQSLTASGSTETSDPARKDVEYLRQIKTPSFLISFPDSDKADAIRRMSSKDFLWGEDDIDSLPDHLKMVLRKGDALYKMFIFIQHMKSALEKGLILPGEVDVRAGVERLYHKIAEAPLMLPQETVNKQAMAVKDLHSYSILGDPAKAKTNDEKFQAACKHRNLHAPGASISPHLDVNVSDDQRRAIFKVDARAFSLGAILKSALDVNVGKGLAARKLNMLGEIDGVACITNSPDRLRRLKQAVMLATSIEQIKLGKQKNKAEKKKKKENKAKAKKDQLERERPIAALLDLPPDTKVTAIAMKAYLSEKNITLPKVPGQNAKKKANLITFFTEICKQMAGTSLLPATAANKAAQKIERIAMDNAGEEGGQSDSAAADDVEMQDDEEEEDEGDQDEEESDDDNDEEDDEALSPPSQIQSQRHDEWDSEQSSDEEEDALEMEEDGKEENDDEELGDEEEEDEEEEGDEGEEGEEDSSEDDGLSLADLKAGANGVVENILRHKGPKKNRELLVKWKGHREMTWEPEANLRQSAAVWSVEKYWEQQAANEKAKAASEVAARQAASSNPIMVTERATRATRQSIYDDKLAKFKLEEGKEPTGKQSADMWDAALVEMTAADLPQQGRPKRQRRA
jgi:hypothetical protein